MHVYFPHTLSHIFSLHPSLTSTHTHTHTQHVTCHLRGPVSDCVLDCHIWRQRSRARLWQMCPLGSWAPRTTWPDPRERDGVWKEETEQSEHAITSHNSHLQGQDRTGRCWDGMGRTGEERRGHAGSPGARGWFRGRHSRMCEGGIVVQG